MENSLECTSPSLSRRKLLNFLTGAALATTAGAALYPVAKVFVPPVEKTGVGGAVRAKDKLGNPIPASQILIEPPGTRALVAGIAAQPTYLTLQNDGTLSDRGIVDDCTHLGCTFPWNEQAQEFQCPCHGSRYAPDGTVVRGPAGLPLKLVRVKVEGDRIWITPWMETDPRTGERPWWV
ncbi:cytochrome b6-f complex iron-sulfur subunit [Synechococcus sp. PCC 7336]|uniref:cytochrome b6-f complex iron-sulfur subunit n=1 Tax=Synechococcus sp. PCC 7336 TaxID=195250 RepID=UPI0003451FE6|nr:cytochrome b6-f complex iron-sulfur subunit [Synechococcus sp. PCC 7336]